ncbi:MAG: hypothetical protein LBK47_00710 [Prevotellaceae bacterium]|jgi:hypothetical protein|nr:hypothetical protein [Prevotellaceae bacterium]
MKKNVFFAAFAAVAVAAALVSCGGQKSITAVNNEKEVAVPCDDKRTDKSYFRGIGVGQSKDLNAAREKARMNANAELAGGMSTIIKSVAEKYVNDAGQAPADYAETFESMTKQVINQEINNVSVCCNKTVQTQDGMYKVYLAVEANKDEVLKAIERNAAANKKLETAFNREKFREQFDAEMADFAKKNGY